ncbi:hypothetical protein PVAND_006952 [Polypedilum vanderplanki]|uniref:Uncharacterized protein n=1 Tax=Polypedilum vanderplanki TaxID=319348 RepID=A0A9J6C5R2_POLVA|nr:hypothetical protein PVAND_006952 [Polypedilum vanderplanki]
MKFGNYNLTSASEKHNRLFFTRLKKVKNTSNYIVGKFNNQINTIRKISRRKACQHHRYRYTDSPLSFRASLFDNRRHHHHLISQSEKCRELREKLERYRTTASENIYETCYKYVPDDFHRPTSSLFDRESRNSHQNVFDKVKFSKVNNAISGKRQHKMLKNVYFTIKSNQCNNLSNLYESLHYESLKRGSMKKSYKYSPPKIDEEQNEKLRSDISTLLRTSKCDEKTELEVLKNYFDYYSYSDICNDDNFKNYLKKKNYQDAIDYIYSGHSLLGSSLRGESCYGSVTDVLKRYYDLDLDIVKDPSHQNDCDSVKYEKQSRRSQSIDRRKYYNRENSEFFCKSNKEFDDYYKRNIAIFYEATKTVDDDFFQKEDLLDDAYRTYDRPSSLFYHHNDDELLIDELYECKNQAVTNNYNTMPEKRKVLKEFRGNKLDSCSSRRIASFDIDDGNAEVVSFEDENDNDDDLNGVEFKRKYQTYPLKRKAKENYKQLLRYCEKSLANYSTVADMRIDKWCKSSNLSREFSEKGYNKIIKSFVRLRGFDTVEAYIQYHYGRMLDKSFDSKLKIKLREVLNKRDEQLVISRPILRTTTQSSVIANNRLDSLPPPYTSIDNDNNYFYKKHQSSYSDNKTSKATMGNAMKMTSFDDCFKHYDYIDVNYESKLKQSSTVNANESHKRFLFKFVEDMHDVGIKFDEILSDEEETTYENFLESENYNEIITNAPLATPHDNDYKTLTKILQINRNSEESVHRNTACIDNIYESIENEQHQHCKQQPQPCKNNIQSSRHSKVDKAKEKA